MAGMWRRLPMTIAMIVAPASGLYGSAAEREVGEATENPAMTAEQILANPLDESAYARKNRCLATTRYRRIEIVGNMALAFHGRSGGVWLNVLPRRCPGLAENATLVMQRSGLRVCAQDRFRAMSPGHFDAAASICLLGMFERVTPERLEAMRTALAAHWNTKTIARTVRAVENEAVADAVADAAKEAEAAKEEDD